MDWFLEPFLLGFQQRALLGGLAAGVMSSVVGVWLVLRGMSFFGDAFVHGVLPGIAAATIFGCAWPHGTHHRPAVPSRMLRPSTSL